MELGVLLSSYPERALYKLLDKRVNSHANVRLFVGLWMFLLRLLKAVLINNRVVEKCHPISHSPTLSGRNDAREPRSACQRHNYSAKPPLRLNLPQP